MHSRIVSEYIKAKFGWSEADIQKYNQWRQDEGLPPATPKELYKIAYTCWIDELRHIYAQMLAWAR